MALTAGVVPSMPNMLRTLIFEGEASWVQRYCQPRDHFPCDRSGGVIRHQSYIGRFLTRGTSDGTAQQMAWTSGGSERSLLGPRLQRAGRIPRAADPGGFRRARRMAM